MLLCQNTHTYNVEGSQVMICHPLIGNHHEFPEFLLILLCGTMLSGVCMCMYVCVCLYV